MLACLHVIVFSSVSLVGLGEQQLEPRQIFVQAHGLMVTSLLRRNSGSRLYSASSLARIDREGESEQQILEDVLIGRDDAEPQLTQKLQPPRLIVFLHVPKAAGTSMAQALMSVSPTCTSIEQCARSAIVFHHAAKLNGTVQGVQGGRNLWGCRGHLDMTTIDSELRWRGMGRNSVMLVTILRSPIERLVSEYTYTISKTNPSESSLQFLQQADDVTFDWLLGNLTQNMRILDYVNFPFSVAEYGTINDRQVSLFSGVEYSHEKPETKFKIAQRNLQTFDFVGLTEEFSASMRLLQHTLVKRFGYSNRFMELSRAGSIHVNDGHEEYATRSVFGTNPGWYDVVVAKNKLDLQLYECVKHDFYKNMCESLSECDGPPLDRA